MLKESLDDRLVEMCKRAIGCTLRVKIDPKTSVIGTVVEARFVGWGPPKGGEKKRKSAQFEVVLEAGEAKTRWTKLVEQVPNGTLKVATVFAVDYKKVVEGDYE